MTVGASIGSGQMDNMITSAAVDLRDVAQDIAQLSLSVNGQGQGLAYLVSLDFSDAPNPDNPGGISDAAYALSMISYENTVAGVYFGTPPSPRNSTSARSCPSCGTGPLKPGCSAPSSPSWPSGCRTRR